MAINQFVSSAQIFADLQDEIGQEHRLSIPRMRRFVTRCLNKIVGRLMLEPFICVMTFTNNKIILPDNAVLIDGMIWGDQGTQCWTLFDKYRLNVQESVRAYNVFVAMMNQGEIVNFYDFNYNIVDNTMMFNQDYNGKQVTMKFWGYKTDCDGNPMIPEFCIDAVLAYLKMMIAQRGLWRKSEDNLPKGMYQEYMEQWDNHYRGAVGDLAILGPLEQQEAAFMLHNGLSGSVDSYWHIFPF